MRHPEEFARLRWQCRRGMRELDLILLPFLEKKFAALSEVDKALFADLLVTNDVDLYRWLVVRDLPADLRFVSIVEKIHWHVELSL